MATPLIAFLTPVAAVTRAEIERLAPPGFCLIFAQTHARTEHVQMLARANYAVPAATWMDRDLILQAPHLKMIQKWCVGIDKIDLQAAREAGVTVAITPGASAGPVAEHTVMLMLAVLRRLPLAHRSLTQGQWIPAALRTLCFQLAGKTVGLLGFGNIARQVAKRLQGFDVNVIYHSRTRVDPALETLAHATYVDHDTLFAQSDILSLHIPSTPATHHLIDANMLSKMKPTAILINTARGELIDEAALLQALNLGRLAAAGLDTFESEPPPASHPLLHMDQVVVTPHAAAGVFDNLANIVGHIFRNIQLFEAGQPLPAADLVVATPIQK